MKAILTIVFLFVASHVFAQSKAETEMLQLSKKIFTWEVEGKIDSLANLFDDKLIIVGSSGTARSKNDYLTDLKSGKPIHNNIDIQEASASIFGTTGIVAGKGIFTVTVAGNKATYHLAYMEVFRKEKEIWKLIALHASRLSD